MLDIYKNRNKKIILCYFYTRDIYVLQIELYILHYLQNEIILSI